MSNKKIYLYPVWIRLWHWLNALLCLLLIITGLSMQYAGPEINLIRFDIAVSLHNITGIALTASYLIFFIGNLVTKNGRYYNMRIKGLLKRLMKQFRFYTIGIFKNEESPYPISKKRKFNPLQKFTYIVTMYIFLPLVFISGWALLFPEIIIDVVFGWSGIHLTDLLHVITGFFISIFMMVHIYFCTIGTTASSNFKSMINGWH
ncbi:cytochrome b/b6 domain-containing protein [Bacteroidota bacterium]